MNAGKITGNDSIESPHNSQLAAAFLGKITKCKKFNFNKTPLYYEYSILTT
jgi:hypothetical protein